MMKYTDRLNAPLMFHKFFNYIFLPLSFLFAMERLVVEHALLFSGHWLTTIDACSVLATLTLSALAFVGLLQWKGFGWYAVMGLQAAQLVFALITLVISASLIPDQLQQAAVQSAGTVLRTVLVGLYYLKRRPLFCPAKAPASTGAEL